MRAASFLALAGGSMLAACTANEPAPTSTPTAQKVESCEALAGMALKDGKIDAATSLAGGAVVNLEAGKPGLPAPAAFCRVQATLSPVPGSSIKVEVWLPERAGWNGKLLGAGNGGFGANMLLPSLLMRGAVQKGYAAVGTDMGHFGESDVDASWALNAPEKIRDYGWRANHVGAETAKQVIAAFYEGPLAASYFHGCSDGGRQALTLAQRYPADYDAIIAGAPAMPWTRMASAFTSNAIAANKPGGDLSMAKLKLLQTASLGQCDGLDGVKDGVIDDPRACHFDPAKLACKGGDGADCLTAGEVATAKLFYEGPKTADGKSFYRGFAPGAEAEAGTWAMWLTGSNSQHVKFGTQFFRYFVHANPEWQLSEFNLDRDYALAKARVGGDLDADKTDLGAFYKRGGKLILYHGWNDAGIPAQNTVDYYERLVAANPRATATSVRLFMVPGMSHCLAGPGPNNFDPLAALDGWRQGGPAPERIIATKYDNDLFAYIGLPAKAGRTRPLCPFPKVAKWDRKGSTDTAESFVCEAPGK
ncbi:MAG: tannase/feruloyl esterase family alpha/beta hydrolase [Sphingopyxis sp.]|nr:tannase/feruloyl esterase family alpha/beta hydrolase [Sphingopyxis sp.]